MRSVRYFIAMLIFVEISFSAILVYASTIWPNEPDGATVITDNPYNCLACNGWGLEGGNSVVSDGTSPLSPSSVFQMTFSAGHQGGYGGGNSWYPLNNLRELYAGFWWKPSDPWEGLTGGQKINFIMGGNGKWNIVLLLNGQQSGIPLKVSLYYPNSANVSNGHVVPSWGDDPGSRQIFANVSNPTITLGAWHRLELYVKMSATPTSRDGIIRWWIDGALAGNHTNVNYPTDPIVQYENDATWGNIGDRKSFTHYFWYDHVRLSTGGSGANGTQGDTAPPARPTGLVIN